MFVQKAIEQTNGVESTCFEASDSFTIIWCVRLNQCFPSGTLVLRSLEGWDKGQLKK